MLKTRTCVDLTAPLPVNATTLFRSHLPRFPNERFSTHTHTHIRMKAVYPLRRWRRSFPLFQSWKWKTHQMSAGDDMHLNHNNAVWRRRVSISLCSFLSFGKIEKVSNFSNVRDAPLFIARENSLWRMGRKSVKCATLRRA